MESFFHTLKTELVMHCDYKTRDDARVSLFDYMEVFYNRQRRHSSISYEAPLPFEAMKSPNYRVHGTWVGSNSTIRSVSRGQVPGSAVQPDWQNVFNRSGWCGQPVGGS